MTTPAESSGAANAADDASRQGRIPADTFAVRLLLSRHLAGLSIKDAAHASGLNDATWATWESGRRPRDLVDVCQRVARGLDIDFNWLLLGGPLAGPRGRETQGLTNRPTSDTFWNPPSSVRSSSRRPSAGRPNNRGDSSRPKVGRPVVIDHSMGVIADRLGDVA